MPGSTSAWESGLIALQIYYRARGSLDPPRSARAGGFPVGAWVTRLREDYWDATLDPDAIAALDALPGWSWGPGPAQSWRVSYLAWKQCSAELEACTTSPDRCEAPLERWARHQRDTFAAGTLHPYHIALLEQLPGWVSDPAQHRWHRGLVHLAAYLDDHGTAEVPRTFRADDGFPLGQWVHRCREDFRAGVLPTERIAALEALPGWRWGERPAAGAAGWPPCAGSSTPTAMPPRASTTSTVTCGWDSGWPSAATTTAPAG